MLPSEQKAMIERVKQAEAKLDERWYAALRHAVEIVNRAEYLTLEQKTKLLEGFYK